MTFEDTLTNYNIKAVELTPAQLSLGRFMMTQRFGVGVAPRQTGVSVGIISTLAFMLSHVQNAEFTIVFAQHHMRRQFHRKLTDHLVILGDRDYSTSPTRVSNARRETTIKLSLIDDFQHDMRGLRPPTKIFFYDYDGISDFSRKAEEMLPTLAHLFIPDTVSIMLLGTCGLPYVYTDYHKTSLINAAINGDENFKFWKFSPSEQLDELLEMC